MRSDTTTAATSYLAGCNLSKVLPYYAGIPRVARYTGPHRFLRAAGRDASGSLADAYSGTWWADEAVLFQIAGRLSTAQLWMTADERQRAWPAQYRALMALCEDWNDMSEIFALEIPAGETLEGLVGPAAAQPEFSVKDPLGRHNPRRVLSGGAEQVFFRVKNPFWVREIVPF
jgi:hypothetical protein